MKKIKKYSHYVGLAIFIIAIITLLNHIIIPQIEKTLNNGEEKTRLIITKASSITDNDVKIAKVYTGITDKKLKYKFYLRANSKDKKIIKSIIENIVKQESLNYSYEDMNEGIFELKGGKAKPGSENYIYAVYQALNKTLPTYDVTFE